MRTISLAEAKTHLSELLNQAEIGEEIIITRHGRPVAKLAGISKTIKPFPFTELETLRNAQPKAKNDSVSLLQSLREESRY
ncbi:type II toxin-antitoxin system Phd/YefM family antitoxin [Candidatus Venteria ishoeyi]|uniref:Antitoxin n=1 Tax=Candidatus Venteria ishoeyi TaxID=1899563 RepID=A0A1H6FBN9_9GAMM|nr:type II toxin-antitoxin system prevent-host-death family antitoxin [Candidatus Venteria ishoeyi]SEH06444.1 Phd_YefM [Candidatus Venteria ishoeyi]